MKPKSAILTNYKELEYDLKPDVKEALLLLTCELPKPETEMTIDELENAILSMKDMHYEIARWKRKGKSLQWIAEKTGLSTSQISIMLRKFYNISHRLLPVETAELRNEVLMQLDDFLSGLYNEANNEGFDYLTSGQIPAALGILDRKMKLLNITPPQQVQLTVSEEILQAKSQLDKLLENFKNVIDVTPTEES